MKLIGSLASCVFMFIIFSSTVPLIKSQVLRFGRCPTVKTVSNFEEPRFLGVWYEIRRYPFFFNLGGKCVTNTYGQYANGTATVLYRQITNSGQEFKIFGTTRLIKSGVYYGKFPTVPIYNDPTFQIIYTDYDNMTVVFACRNFLATTHREMIWIFSRTKSLTKEQLEKAYSVIKSNKLSVDPIESVDQKNCPKDENII